MQAGQEYSLRIMKNIYIYIYISYQLMCNDFLFLANPSSFDFLFFCFCLYAPDTCVQSSGLLAMFNNF